MRNVVKKIEKGHRNIFGVCLLSTVIALSFAGCNGSRESICRDFPAVAEEIKGIQIEIAAVESRPEPKRGAKSGRKLASVPSESVADHREAWLEWGEKALKRTQWAKDALEDDRRGRKAVPALNEAGLSLVSFHGFLDQRKWKKADAELDRVEASLVRARKIACDAEPASVSLSKHGSKHPKKAGN